MKFKLFLKIIFVGLFFTSTAFGMNKAELVDAIASNADLSKADAKRALEGFISSTESALKKGDRISLVGFGSFSVSNRAARTGRNPQTGKEIKIAAKKVVKFKAGAALSNAVKSSGQGGGKVYEFSPDGVTATRAFGKFFTNFLLGLNSVNSQVVGWSVDDQQKGRDETHTQFPESATKGHRATISNSHFYLAPEVWGGYIDSDFQDFFLSEGAESLEEVANIMLDEMQKDTAWFLEKHLHLLGHEAAHVVQQRSRIVITGGIVGIVQAAADMQSDYVRPDDDDSDDMIDSIARITGIEKSDIKRALNALYDATARALQSGEVVSLGRLGNLSVPVNAQLQANQMLRDMQKGKHDASISTINNVRIVVGGGNDGDLRLKVATKK